MTAFSRTSLAVILRPSLILATPALHAKRLVSHDRDLRHAAPLPRLALSRCPISAISTGPKWNVPALACSVSARK